MGTLGEAPELTPGSELLCDLGKSLTLRCCYPGTLASWWFYQGWMGHGTCLRAIALLVWLLCPGLT